MRRLLVLLLLLSVVVGCDPVQTLTLHNDLGETAQIDVAFHVPGTAANDMEKDRWRLAPGERVEQMLTWSSLDWIEFSWRGAKHSGKLRLRGVDLPVKNHDVYFGSNGVVFGPRNWIDVIDETFGATKPLLVVFALVAVFVRWRRAARRVR